MSPSQRKQVCPSGSEKRKLRPCIDSLSIPMHIVKLKKDGLFMPSIRHSLGHHISEKPSACNCQGEEYLQNTCNVITAFKPKVETFPCGTTNGFRDPNKINKKILKTRYVQSDFPESEDQNCDYDDEDVKQRTLRFAASTPRENYLNDYLKHPVVLEEPCPEECPPCDESPNYQHFPDKYRSRRNYPGYQNFRTSSLKEEPCPDECPRDDFILNPNFRPSSVQHKTFPDKYKSRRSAPGKQHFRTTCAQHEPCSEEYPSDESPIRNKKCWMSPLNDAQPECCLDKTPHREAPSKNKNFKSLGVQHESCLNRRPEQLTNSTSCENWPKYLAELLEEKLRSDSNLLNDSRSNEQSLRNCLNSPSCSQNYINRNSRDIATDKRTVELIDRATSTTTGYRTTERSTEPRVNFKQTNDTRDLQQHYSTTVRGQNPNLVDGSASPVTVLLPMPCIRRPEFKNNENLTQSREQSPCRSNSKPNSQSQLDEIRGKKLNQSFGEPLTKNGDDPLTDKFHNTHSCPCHYPPAFNDIACSGRITGLCNCGKN